MLRATRILRLVEHTRSAPRISTSATHTFRALSTGANTDQEESYVLRSDNTEDGIATLCFNRPKKLNSLSEEMLSALQSNLDAIAKDRSIRVVILKGKGRAFSAGHDLKQMRATPSREYYRSLFTKCGRLMTSLMEMPQPVIAQVSGMAAAAGCQLVATCDLAVASDEARFATPGINVGLFCSTPAVPLSRNISQKRAFEMLTTGDFIDAKEALNFGLINKMVPLAELDEATLTLARKISSKSATSIAIGKKMFYRQLAKPDFVEALEYASKVMACNMMDADTSEGIDAFIGKRPPTWQKEREPDAKISDTVAP